MRQDPFRVSKDEFLHKLHEIHKHGGPVGSLDVSELAAAKMLLTDTMHREGVVLTVGETADMVGEMARVVGGSTELAGQQIVSQMDYERRMRKIGGMQRRNEQKARDLLLRKNRGG